MIEIHYMYIQLGDLFCFTDTITYLNLSIGMGRSMTYAMFTATNTIIYLTNDITYSTNLTSLTLPGVGIKWF